MSAYVGAQVRLVHGFYDTSGRHIKAGSLGMCIADHSTLLSIELRERQRTSLVRLPHALVDIIEPEGDEVAWVNE